MWFEDWLNDLFAEESDLFREVRPPRKVRHVPKSVKPDDLDDLLDFQDDPIGGGDRALEHVVYARLIPFLAAAAQVVSGGKANARKTRLDAYLPVAKEEIADAGLQTTYLRSFVTRTMKQVSGMDRQTLFSMAAKAGDFLRERIEADQLEEFASLARGLAWGITSEGEALLDQFVHPMRSRFSSGHTVPIRHIDDEEPDLFLLGLAPGASDEEIRHAYRRLVRQNHPDMNKGHEQDAARKLMEIEEAYHRLKAKRGF